MPKVSSERMNLGEYRDSQNSYQLKFDVYVGVDGIFSTTLPKDFVAMLQSANIELNKNRIGTEGYVWDKTKEGLLAKIKKLGEEYYSREEISQEIVIKYCIMTTAAYGLTTKGEVVPNMSGEWKAVGQWKNGTKDSHASNPAPYGVQVYAQPFFKMEYKYKSGKQKTEYKGLSPFGSRESPEGMDYLYWLESVCSHMPPKGGDIMEIPYTEATAKFFVDMIKAICLLNERIKDFTTPEMIMQLVDKGQKLLG